MSLKATMRREHKPRSGMALGGLGTGSFEIRHDGIFYNWSIFNNAPMGLGSAFPLGHDSLFFFVVRYQEAGGLPKMRLLQIEESHDAGALVHHQHHYVFPWLDGVDQVDYDASFPFAKLKFKDQDMPFTVEMEAWSPFIPHDAKNSSLPGAFFNFTITSKTKKPVDVMLMASLRNAVGYDVPEKTYQTALHQEQGWKACEMTCAGMNPAHASFGTMGLASFADDTTWYLGWEALHPYYEIVLRSKQLPNLDDTAGRNVKDKETGQLKAMARLFSTLAVSCKLTPKAPSFAHTFAMTWHFPNRYAQDSHVTWPKPPAPAEHVEGHYYDNFFRNSTEVAAYLYANRDDLFHRSRAFHQAFFDSTAPAFVLDQINSQLNTLPTSSWFTKDGFFGVVEGLDQEQVYAGLNTMDVMMYGGVMVAALFPELDRRTMLEYARFQGPDGRVAHSISRNLREIQEREIQSLRLDMPMQFVYMSLRAWLWSPDRTYLEKIWPAVKRALDYGLRERDKNHDGLPDMEGVMCTYDNFPMHGVASFLGSQWLAAVALAADAARELGEQETEQRYREVYTRARQVFEEKVWNGKYYRLWNDDGGRKGGKDEGCLTDQVIGQWAAHLVGLGHILDPKRVSSALRHVMKANYHPEQGLRNCSWPQDGYLHDVDKDAWVDQANTCWTGVELGFASLLLYEGLYKEALTIIGNVDARHRHWGMYWDHQEFGGHYFRPMSAWGIVNGLLGLTIRDGSYGFNPRLPEANQRLFFAFGQGTGHYTRKVSGEKETIRLTIHTGTLSCRELTFGLVGKKKRNVTVRIGENVLPKEKHSAIFDKSLLTITFPQGLVVTTEQELMVIV